jgi:hypothetical protein
VSDQIDEIGFNSSLFTSVSDIASSGCFSSARLSFGGTSPAVCARTLQAPQTCSVATIPTIVAERLESYRIRD